jgi:hypothetical protein
MKPTLMFMLLLCLSCTYKTQQAKIQITLTDMRKNLKISGMDYAVMQDINRDTTVNIWQNLIQVYRMPADTDLKDYQPIQPGKYMVQDSAVIFIPDTPFNLHQTYFMRYYQYDKGSTAWAYIKNHQKPGKKQYLELIFKQ